MFNFIELSDLIGFGYDLSDTQDELKCWRMGFKLCGIHPHLLTRIKVSDSGPMCPLVSNHLTKRNAYTNACVHQT